MEDEEVKLCRSKSPDGHPCAKARGHNREQHFNREAPKKWVGGINTGATWHTPAAHYGTGDMSEGEYQAFGRFGY